MYPATDEVIVGLFAANDATVDREVQAAAAPDSGGLFMCRPGWRGQAPTPMQGAQPSPKRIYET